jgi:hypothetical protein
MIQLLRWPQRSRASGGGAGMALAIALALAFTLIVQDAAFACRGVQYWSTGADLNALKPGEIVVKARLIEAYKTEKTYPTIMGIPFGMIYFVQVAQVVGGPAGKSAADELRDAKVFIRLQPSPCETYYPRNFDNGGLKILVLKKGDSGLYDLVGGQE